MSLRTHITTGTLAAAFAIGSIAGWNHFHSSDSVAKVDILGIINSQQKSLAARLKPGMDEKAQTALIDEAARFGKKLDAALAQVVSECRCTLLNSASSGESVGDFSRFPTWNSVGFDFYAWS